MDSLLKSHSNLMKQMKKTLTVYPFEACLIPFFFLLSGWVFHNNNQWGLYDSITLGIPRVLETACLDNGLFSNQKLKLACRILTSPLWIPLQLLRYGFGVLCILMAFPVVGLAYLNETQTDNIPSNQDEPWLPEFDAYSNEFDNDTYKKSLQQFDKYYKKLENDFAKRTDRQDKAWQTTTTKHHRKAVIAAQEADYFFQNYIIGQELGYYAKFNNLSPYGKYSINFLLSGNS